MPFTDPSLWLYREYDGGISAWLPVIPLRVGIAHAFEIKIFQHTLTLMAGARFIGPEMPVMDLRLHGRNLSRLRRGGDGCRGQRMRDDGGERQKTAGDDEEQ